MPDTDKITAAELTELFGAAMPWDVYELLWNGPPEKTVGEVRADLRALARARRPFTPAAIVNEELQRLEYVISKDPEAFAERVDENLFILRDARSSNIVGILLEHWPQILAKPPLPDKIPDPDPAVVVDPAPDASTKPDASADPAASP